VIPAGGFVELAAELLGRGHQVRFRAAGRSMTPAIRDGEVLRCEPVRPEAVRVVDVLLYRRRERVIAHRVVRIDRGAAGARFILRGDASAGNDAPVGWRQVLGRVTAVERGSPRCTGRRRQGVADRPWETQRFSVQEVGRAQAPLWVVNCGRRVRTAGQVVRQILSLLHRGIGRRRP
jgi:hypothetical protein